MYFCGTFPGTMREILHWFKVPQSCYSGWCKLSCLHWGQCLSSSSSHNLGCFPQYELWSTQFTWAWQGRCITSVTGVPGCLLGCALRTTQEFGTAFGTLWYPLNMLQNSQAKMSHIFRLSCHLSWLKWQISANYTYTFWKKKDSEGVGGEFKSSRDLN